MSRGIVDYVMAYIKEESSLKYYYRKLRVRSRGFEARQEAIREAKKFVEEENKKGRICMLRSVLEKETITTQLFSSPDP